MTDVLDLCMAFDLDQIESELKAGGDVTVQFDKPIGDTLLIVDPAQDDFAKWPQVPADAYLERLNTVCADWGAQLTVRFYAHYSDVFDASVLERLPDIHSLAADCLERASNLEAISGLEKLSKLSLGIYELDDKAVLSKLPLAQLREFTLSPAQTKALDLAPLAEASALRRLYIEGHHKNIAELAALNQLESFTFNAKTGLDLSFINGMVGLRALKFNLGGTHSIADITLPKLEDLAFTMTKNLSELGDLQRFATLRRLFMQDQQNVSRIQVGAGNKALEHLWFYNCKNLEAIEGLADCPKLKSLRWLFTQIDPASLTFPKSLTHLHMLSGKRKLEEQEKTAITQLGYVAEDHPNAWFFYK